MYVTRHRKDRDGIDIITGIFFIHTIPYFALIDISSTYSYIVSNVSMDLEIFIE